uniref:histidine kinase n=1 Tax=uncultured bacterium Contig52 TaxID=1393584 RepID=W0FJQ9_9BACT|nr:sensor histidine kinase [uncultured bacterium Contig52]
MIRQLQKRFIRIAVISLTMAMVLVVAIVNIANWVSVRNELFGTLNLLDENETEMEQIAEAKEDRPDLPESEDNRKNRFPGPSRHFRNMMAESNWFSAMVSETGEVERVLLARIENLEEGTARELIRQIVADGRTEGFLQDYLFRITTWRNGNREVMVLNCETRLATVRTLILISAIACAGGILLAMMLVMLFSRKAIQPTIRNMEQQKQFITNASHELKTPLTVISTNMELLEMENEGNPWVRSTQNQAAVMRRLVDELVYLSRMEEEHPTLEFESLDPGELLKETAEPFAAMAEYNGLEMTVIAEKNLQMNGDRASIQRLISTLCDNAVKYASAGPICAEIRGEGKNIILQLSNPVEEPLTKQQCEQLFNRFYRVDPSRNKEKRSGFGIGLAIAAAIAEKHGGRIAAAMEENRLVITCQMPKEKQ